MTALMAGRDKTPAGSRRYKSTSVDGKIALRMTRTAWRMVNK